MSRSWAGLALVGLAGGCFSPVSDEPPEPQKRLVFVAAVNPRTEVDSFGDTWAAPRPALLAFAEQLRGGRVQHAGEFYLIDGLAAAVSTTGRVSSVPSRYFPWPNYEDDGWFEWNGGWYKYSVHGGLGELRIWRLEPGSGSLVEESTLQPRLIPDAGWRISPEVVMRAVRPVRVAGGASELCFTETHTTSSFDKEAYEQYVYLTDTWSGPVEAILSTGVDAVQPMQDGVRERGRLVALLGRWRRRLPSFALTLNARQDWRLVRQDVDGGVSEEVLPASRQYRVALIQQPNSVDFASHDDGGAQFWRADVDTTTRLGEATVSPGALVLMPISAQPPLVVQASRFDGGYVISTCGQSSCRPIHVVGLLPVSFGIADGGVLELAEYVEDAGVLLWEFPRGAWEPR